MTRKHRLYFTALLPILSGCYVHQAFYSSPFNGNNNSYQTIPMRSDSVPSACYVNATYIVGNANDAETDHVYALQSAISGSQNFGHFQAFYGGNLTLGNYNMGTWDTSSSPGGLYGGRIGPPPAFATLNGYSGSRYFGGVGFSGGMNLATTFRSHPAQIQQEDTIDTSKNGTQRSDQRDTGKIGWRRFDLRRFDPRFKNGDPRFRSDESRIQERNRRLRGSAGRVHIIEWRIIGFETSMTHEFGDYLQFRKQMPDSAATLIVRSSFFATVGLTTELVRKIQDGQIGWKFASGWALGSSYNFLEIHDNASQTNLGGYGYFSFTFHYTVDQYTAFFQVISATKATGIHFGLNYQIGGKRPSK
jgi:hypothetical protein